MDEKQFGILPPKKIFAKLAIPGLISMLFASISMMVDGIFVGNFIGNDALAAVNLVMPIIMILFAVGDMIAIGSSVKISIKLGEKEEDEASKLFTASILIVFIIGLFVTVMGSLFSEKIIYALIKDKELASLSYDYTKALIGFIPFIMPMFAVDNYLRICGKANYSMYVNLSVALLNVILDAIFIGYFRLGIEYAGLATVLSMSVGTIAGIMPFVLKKVTLRFTKPQMKMSDLLGIMYNGSSEFFNNISGSLMAIVTNAMLLKLGGAIAVGSYAIVMYIDSMLISMLYGMQDAMQPAVSYNLGAKKIERTFSFFKISCIAALTVSMSCMIGMYLFPEFLVSLFSSNEDIETINMAKTALMLYAPSYLFTWFNMVASSYLTAFDKPKESVMIMVLKAVIFPLISIFVMSNIMGVYGIYITPAVSGGLTFISALIIWKKTTKKISFQNQLV